MTWTLRQKWVISIVAVTAFMGTFLISSVNVALPAIEQAFEMSAVTLSWVITAFLLSTAMFLLPVGRLSDLAGIRRLFKVGVVIFTVSSLLCALSGSGFWLILFRYLQGAGAALTTTTGPAILVSDFPARKRGQVLGYTVAAVYLGLATGPFAGGMLTQYLGWRSIFFVSFALGVATAFIAFLSLGRDSQKNSLKGRVDFKGTVFYMAGLVALVYGSSLIPRAAGWLLMGVGGIFFVVFWVLERYYSLRPVIETSLYTRNRLFAYSNLAALINYSATFAIVFLLSLYLQKIQGLSPRDAGGVLVAQPIVMVMLSPITGRLSDRIPARYMATLGMAICMTGLFALAFVNQNTPIWTIIAILIWVGTGFALFSAPNMNTILSSVDKSRSGMASGSAATMRVLGQIISMTIATLFFAAIIGDKPLENAPDHLFLKAMKYAFFSFTIICLAGIYFSFTRQRKQTQSTA